MATFTRFLQLLSLGVWVGSILYFAAVVAPGAFAVLQADQAGALVGLTLSRLHFLGIAAGLIYLAATALGARSGWVLLRPAPLFVMAMIVLTAISQFRVVTTMDALRAQMGSVASTPATNSLRASFDRLHTLSVRLESAVLLGGLIAMALLSRKSSP